MNQTIIGRLKEVRHRERAREDTFPLDEGYRTDIMCELEWEWGRARMGCSGEKGSRTQE